jgi:hypothetical protein
LCSVRTAGWTRLRPRTTRYEVASLAEQVTPAGVQFISFNAGPRLCLGRSLALMEAKLLLASVLRRFAFQLDPSCKVRRSASCVCALGTGRLVCPGGVSRHRDAHDEERAAVPRAAPMML